MKVTICDHCHEQVDPGSYVEISTKGKTRRQLTLCDACEDAVVGLDGDRLANRKSDSTHADVMLP